MSIRTSPHCVHLSLPSVPMFGSGACPVGFISLKLTTSPVSLSAFFTLPYFVQPAGVTVTFRFFSSYSMFLLSSGFGSGTGSGVGLGAGVGFS